MIIIPFYVDTKCDETTFNNNCKLALACIHSYFYHGNVYKLEVVTNDDRVISLMGKFNKIDPSNQVSINIVDKEYFETVKFGDLSVDSLAHIQSSVKPSTIYNYSKEVSGLKVLMDFDMLFLSRIEFEFIENKFVLFNNQFNIGGFDKTIKEMLVDDKCYLKFKNHSANWQNSGVIAFDNVHDEMVNIISKFKPDDAIHSDEYLFNKMIDDENKLIKTEHYSDINIQPVSTIKPLLTEGVVHFYNPWFKPYIVTIDEHKELKIGISTNHKVDYIPLDYLDQLLEYTKFHNKFFIHNCFQWWYYYADVMGHIGDLYEDFKYYDSKYFKHLIEKLF